MVTIRLPDVSGKQQLNPKFYRSLKKGSVIYRVFALGAHCLKPLFFRHYGPLLRFDHHRGKKGNPLVRANDLIRGILYGAPTLSGCIVEIFGDTQIIVSHNRNGDPYYIAVIKVVRDFLLLDLRRQGAMRAGTVSAIAKCDHVFSQAASRIFYETPAVYKRIDGLIYLNAHNDEDAFAFYERAKSGLSCPKSHIVSISDPSIRAPLLKIANQHLLTVNLP